MKKFVAGFAVGFAVAIIVVLVAVFAILEHHGRYVSREMDRQLGMRDFCAGQISKLSGAKQEAALAWFKQLPRDERGNRIMTEEDLKTCRAF